MKRVIVAVVGTIAGLVGLLSFKSHSLAVGGAVAQSIGTGPAGQPAGGSSGGSTGGGSTGGGSNGGGSRRQPSTAAKRYVGPAVQTPYGVVQVAITVGGGHIEHIRLVRLTAFDPTSQMINSQAAPILVRETEAAQSSHIDVVSGATYTSDGYLQSLQRALDEAGLR